ncbi:MAG: helix-turn-helix transcriptional regulator [Oscillospiraceae bacterium]|nr:helix-turn-helix transcriptional regulator [Oscillospiraceae bacterium]
MEMDVLSKLIIKRVFAAATTIHTEKNTRARRENRGNWAIIIKDEGETVYTSNGRKIITNKDNIIILPKGCSYEWVCIESAHCAIIEFESDLTCEELLHFPVKDGEKILNMFREVEYKQLIKKPMYEIESIRDCYSIILKLISSSEKKYSTNAKQKKILPAVEYIAKHYNERLTNETLAGICGLSTVYFRKLFTDIFGISPMTYIQGIRIKKAKEMLRSDFGSISDVAQSLGYTSIYDFSRAFKKHTGMAPMKYTKMRKEK